MHQLATSHVANLLVLGHVHQIPLKYPLYWQGPNSLGRFCLFVCNDVKNTYYLNTKPLQDWNNSLLTLFLFIFICCIINNFVFIGK